MKTQRGFTLIELVIAMVIIAILVRVAWPVYQDQILRSRHSEAKAALLKAAQLQERNYVNGDPNVANSVPTYVTTAVLAQLFGLANGAVIYSGENPALNTGYYTISVDTATAACALTDCFVLRATPNNGAAANFTDTKSGNVQCGQFTLDSAGRRAITGGVLPVTDCWDR